MIKKQKVYNLNNLDREIVKNVSKEVGVPEDIAYDIILSFARNTKKAIEESPLNCIQWRFFGTFYGKKSILDHIIEHNKLKNKNKDV